MTKSRAHRFCPHCAHPLARKLIGARERPACEVPGCGYVQWDNPIPVVLAVVEFHNQVVLARNATWPADTFSLISGYVEPHEAPTEAVVREVKEELNLDAHVVRLLGCHLVRAANQVVIAYALTGTGKLLPSNEIAETRLLSREDLARYRFDGLPITAMVVRRWLDATDCLP